MEDTFYWMCFDYFKNKENGRPDNTFTIWFGKAFEEYGIKLLRKIAKEKFFKDLRYLGNENKPSLDAAEILHAAAAYAYKVYFGHIKENPHYGICGKTDRPKGTLRRQ